MVVVRLPGRLGWDAVGTAAHIGTAALDNAARVYALLEGSTSSPSGPLAVNDFPYYNMEEARASRHFGQS